MNESPLPATMRAVRLEAFGPPEALKTVEVPFPDFGDDDVVIRTGLAGLIYGDTEVRRGTYYVKPALPWTPGREVAGTVVRAGKNVTSVKPGDRVAALVLGGGCCAEYVVAAAQRPLVLDGPPKGPMAEIIPLTDRVGFDQALAYLVNFRFAHLIFHAWAKVPKGARLLVHGASGGMGSMIVQLARAQDCEIFALCRTQEEMDYCASLGADHSLNTTDVDYVQAILDLTGGRGVDYAFNGVGGDTINTDPNALVPFGEILLYGYVAGKGDFKPFSFDRSVAFKTFCADNFFPNGQFGEATQAMLAWFRSGPLLSATRIFPLEEAAEAHRWLEQGRALGKIALRP